MTAPRVAAARRAINAAVQLRPWDQVVIGCSHVGLLDVLSEGVDDRFAGVVLVSGDHIFADVIAAIALPTEVVGHRSRVATRLQLAAITVTHLRTLADEAA